jgi:hypothetical protein
MTALETLVVGGKTFFADPITFTFTLPEAPLFYTYQYPSVTITSFVPLETITRVFSPKTMLILG